MNHQTARMVLSLTVTCLVAGAVLGLAYNWTEPAKRIYAAQHEQETLQRLLDLDKEAQVIEFRRYVDANGKTAFEPFPEGRFAGRFFIAKTKERNLAGYVTEEIAYGYKSPIRFFVALTPDFTIRGVEVIAHEEDPGLGAEITKPFFKNQFAGRKSENLPDMKVVKEPLPKAALEKAIARKTLSFDQWRAAFPDKPEETESPIYAVTGATISSKALTDGVRRAVLHLQKRVERINP